MNYEQFKALVALEKGAAAPTAEQIACGWADANGITAAGLAALEPYRTKRAIFIAAGLGSRLRPVTLETPKPLVKVNGTRIIDTLIDGVMAAGIEEIYVVCGYLGDKFVELKEKYPNIQLVTNTMYTECNNISSAWLMREHLQNAYVLEADLLVRNPAIFDKYLYHSVYLGIPTDAIDDWYFKTDADGVIYEVGENCAEPCYQMLGISYWCQEDGARLPAHLEETFPDNKNEDWCYVPMFKYKDIYKVHVRPCALEDIQEIDHFDELCEIDPSYNSYRQ